MTVKILVVKSSSMGDIIHALPVVYDIKKALPDARIDWVAEESFKDIPTLAPGVNQVFVTAFRRWRKKPFDAGVRREIHELKQALAAQHYDLVLDIQGLMRSALAASWTKVPVTGYSFKTVREPLAALFYKHRLALPESLGAVKRYRMAAAAALGYEMDPEPAFGLATTALAPVTLQAPYVSMAVNTSRDEKLWPEAFWVAIGQRLHELGLRSALYWGNDTERDRVERLAARIPEAVVVPRSGLAQTATLLAGSEAVIGVDTGLAHLGAALGIPSVGIFVSTPTQTLRLIGDGPTLSLGGVGRCPSVDEVWTALVSVNPSLSKNS